MTRGYAEERAFKQSRYEDIRVLIKDGTFNPVKTSDIPVNPRIFASRFVDALKRVGNGLRKKSILLAHKYSDEGSILIATTAPTVQSFSHRICLSLTFSIPSMYGYNRDILQAYMKCSSKLEREVYMRSPPELRLPPEYVFKIVNPLYGIPELGFIGSSHTLRITPTGCK